MPALNSSSWLLLKRVVRFGDTDAAGVMHFYQLFRWCHEAWEESLQCYGLSASDTFPKTSSSGEDPTVALPIVHCSADFLRPIKTGDQLDIVLTPSKIDTTSFQVITHFKCEGNDVALGLIRHVSISTNTSRRCELPQSIGRWLEASSIDDQIRPL